MLISKTPLLIGLLLCAVIPSLAQKKFLRQGSLIKKDLTINGWPIKQITINYTHDLYLNEPVEGGSYSWLAGEDCPVDALAGSCMPDVYLELRYLHTDRKEYTGYIKLTFHGLNRQSGQPAYDGGTGSPSWNSLVMTYPGNKIYRSADWAQLFWKYGRVTNFFTVDTPHCKSEYERYLQEKKETAQRQEQEKQQKVAKERQQKIRNDQIAGETQTLIAQVPNVSERQSFSEQLRLINTGTASEKQQEYLEKLREDVKTRLEKIQTATARKKSEEDDLEKQIATIKNPADQRRLRNDLATLKTNRQTANDIEYQRLRRSVEEAQQEEEKLQQEQNKFDNTFNSMSSDHQQRQGPSERKQKIFAITNDNSLSSAEKRRLIEEQNQLLEHNERVLKDDDSQKQKADDEMAAMRQENQRKLAEESAGMATAGVLMQKSINNSKGHGIDYLGATRYAHFSIGLSTDILPVAVDIKEKYMYNNGTGNNYARESTTTATGVKSVNSAGFMANGRLEWHGRAIGIGFLGGISLTPFDIYNTIMALIATGAGEDATSTTGSSPTSSNSEETTKNSCFRYNAGVRLYFNSLINEQKLFLQYNYASTSVTHDYKSLSKYEYGTGAYDITDKTVKTQQLFTAHRALGGIQFGKLEDLDDEVALFELALGKEFTTQQFPRSGSPWLLCLTRLKPNKFNFGALVGFGHVQGKMPFLNNTSFQIFYTKSFDSFKK